MYKFDEFHTTGNLVMAEIGDRRTDNGKPIYLWPFLAVPWVCLQFVIVVFPDHTHLLYIISTENLLLMIS